MSTLFCIGFARGLFGVGEIPIVNPYNFTSHNRHANGGPNCQADVKTLNACTVRAQLEPGQNMSAFLPAGAEFH